MFRFNGADIYAANGDLAFSYIPKTGDQFGNRAFAAAGRPYQSRYAASGNRERHILDNIVLVISESDIFQFNVIFGYILVLALHGGRGQQGTHTVGNSPQVKQRGQLRENGKDRTVNLRREHQ